MEGIGHKASIADLVAERLELCWYRRGLRHRINIIVRYVIEQCGEEARLRSDYEDMGERIEAISVQIAHRKPEKVIQVAPTKASLWICLDGVRDGKVELLFRGDKRQALGMTRIPLKELLRKLDRVPSMTRPVAILGMQVVALFQFDGRRQKSLKVQLRQKQEFDFFKLKLEALKIKAPRLSLVL